LCVAHEARTEHNAIQISKSNALVGGGTNLADDSSIADCTEQNAPVSVRNSHIHTHTHATRKYAS